MLDRIKTWARTLKRDSRAVYLAARDPRVPWYAKLLAVAVAGYALSPIDLIPDFIPVIGYLDDLVLVPLGIWLVISLVPKEIVVECRDKASEASPPASRTAMAVIILVWVSAALALGWVACRYWG
ncbi:YkvA family protein [Bradyrhizobium sp. 31Argb]|uniref:YkvA family protein n=1 Tax=Bradyrhizobium sp. 31Argb TaxID=3141247 RepID=UPI003747CC8F